MRKLFIIVVVIIGCLISGNVYAGNLRDQIESKCSLQWGYDYVMIDHCIRMQMKAAFGVDRKYTHYLDNIPKDISEVTIEQRIMVHCNNQWMRGGSLNDYVMYEHCMDNQFEKARELGKIK